MWRKSLNVIASPKESYNSLSGASSISLKPSNIITSAGSSNSVTSVSGFSKPVSLESTGLIQYDLTCSNCSSLICPSKTYVVALLITGFSSSFKNLTHCSAESALWSNCPGKYSTLKILSVSLNGKFSS